MDTLIYLIDEDDTAVLGLHVDTSKELTIKNPIYFNNILKRYCYFDEGFGIEKYISFPLSKVKRYGYMTDEKVAIIYTEMFS